MADSAEARLPDQPGLTSLPWVLVMFPVSQVRLCAAVQVSASLVVGSLLVSDFQPTPSIEHVR